MRSSCGDHLRGLAASRSATLTNFSYAAVTLVKTGAQEPKHVDFNMSVLSFSQFIPHPELQRSYL